MSLLNRFLSFFQPPSSNDEALGSAAAAIAAKTSGQKMSKVHVTYPPRHEGIPLASADDLIEAQMELIKRIKLHAATLDSKFESRFETPIRNLAEYIANIPGSKDSIYGGPGGLFRACMETAFYSFQASDGRIFTGKLGVEDRHLLENRWRYVCFLSGLVWPMGLTLESIRVRNPEGQAWVSRVESITSWAEGSHDAHFYIAWPKDEVEPGPSVAGGALSLLLAGKEGVRYIEEGSPKLITAVSEIASNIRTDFNSIAFDVVSSRWAQLVKNERARMPQNYGRVRYGQHIAPVIVDAMRECISSGLWVVNEKVVLADSKGVYLVWPRAAKDLAGTQALQAQKGLPVTSSGLLQVLIDERLVHVDAQQSAYVDVADADGALFMALKLCNPESCVEGFNPEAYVRSVDANVVALTDPLVEQDLNEKRTKSKGSKVAQNTQKEVTQSREEIAAETQQDALPVLAPPPPAADILMATIGLNSAPASVEPPLAPATPVQATAPAADAVPAQASPSPAATGAGSGNTAKTATPISTKPVNADTPVGSRLGVVEPKSTGPASSQYVTPEAIEKQLGKPFSLMLAKVVKEVSKPEYKAVIITDQKDFVAIPFEAIQEAITSPADLLAALQKHGWLHPDKTKPRAMVHALSVTSGGAAKKQYVMLSRPFIKKASLPL